MPRSRRLNLLCSLRPGGHGGVIVLRGSAAGRAAGDPGDVVGETGAVLDGLELRASGELRAQVEVGGGEVMRGDVAFGRDHALQGIHDGSECALADLALGFLIRIEAEGVVTHGRFHRAHTEEQPAMIAATLIDRRCQAGFQEGVGEIGADCGALGDERYPAFPAS